MDELEVFLFRALDLFSSWLLFFTNITKTGEPYVYSNLFYRRVTDKLKSFFYRYLLIFTPLVFNFYTLKFLKFILSFLSI